MTIKKRLARSNLMMLVIPVLTAGVLLIIGLAAALFLLQTVYLPQMGLSLRELHQTGEQIEALLSGLETFACIYAGAVIAALLLSIALTNLYLTRNIFRHISQPLNALTAGVARIRDGDLDADKEYTFDVKFVYADEEAETETITFSESENAGTYTSEDSTYTFTLKANSEVNFGEDSGFAEKDGSNLFIFNDYVDGADAAVESATLMAIAEVK